jgi:hypothetical protein
LGFLIIIIIIIISVLNFFSQKKFIMLEKKKKTWGNFYGGSLVGINKIQIIRLLILCIYLFLSLSLSHTHTHSNFFIYFQIKMRKFWNFLLLPCSRICNEIYIYITCMNL